MYLVPARSQFKAQFGRDDAAAAVSGIAGDADPHADVILPGTENPVTGYSIPDFPWPRNRGMSILSPHFRDPDLAVDVLIRTRNIAATEPDGDMSALIQNRR